jgi:hypothetical protein
LKSCADEIERALLYLDKSASLVEGREDDDEVAGREEDDEDELPRLIPRVEEFEDEEVDEELP